MKLTEEVLVEAIERHLAKGGRLIRYEFRERGLNGEDCRCALSCMTDKWVTECAPAAYFLKLPIGEVESFVSGWDDDISINKESTRFLPEAYALGQKLAKRYLP